jgi:nitrogenase subunit NifH
MGWSGHVGVESGPPDPGVGVGAGRGVSVTVHSRLIFTDLTDGLDRLSERSNGHQRMRRG